MSDDNVGYKKPPKNNQFKPGQSGNPKGRPKKQLGGYNKSFREDLMQELDETVSMTEGGKQKKVSKRRFLIKRLTADAISGKTSSTRILSGILVKYLEGTLEKEFKKLSEASQPTEVTESGRQRFLRFIKRDYSG